MHNLGDLLGEIRLPKLRSGAAMLPRQSASNDAAWSFDAPLDLTLLHDLGADLPAGHLHLWGGPNGAGKVSVLLSLLCGAAARGRRILYATYDLPADALARRVLAMHAGVSLADIPEADDVSEAGGVSKAGGNDIGVSRASPNYEATLLRLHRARKGLAPLPLTILEARGLGVGSLKDRIVRMPFRPEIVAIDYLQGVTRAPGIDLAAAVRELTDVASHLHLSLVCTVKPDGSSTGTRASSGASLGSASATFAGPGDLATWAHALRGAPDRVAWLAPDVGTGQIDDAAARDGLRRAVILHNRHGDTGGYALRVESDSGAIRRPDA